MSTQTQQAPAPTDKTPTTTKVPLLERILVGKTGLPRAELTDPREESRSIRRAIKGIWRATFILVAYSLTCAISLSAIGALLRHPGDAGTALSLWWTKVGAGDSAGGLDPSAVATGFVAVVVTLFVAHTMQGSDSVPCAPVDAQAEMAARARSIVLDELVYLLGLAGAVTGWLLIRLPGDDADPRSANFLIPLGSILVSCALAALTSRSAESKRLARITAEEQRANLERARDVYQPLCDSAATRGPVLPNGSLAVRQRLTAWWRVFPWKRVAAFPISWSLLWLMVIALRGGATPFTPLVQLGLSGFAMVLTVMIVESVVEGILSRTAAGRGGLLTMTTAVALLPSLLFLLGGTALMTTGFIRGLAVASFGALPPATALIVFRTAAFRTWVALQLNRRVLALDEWLTRHRADTGSGIASPEAVRPN